MFFIEELDQRMVDKFKKAIGVDLVMFTCKTTFLYRKFKIDIFKLDEYLHKRFMYQERIHGSMKDFIKMKFGENIIRFIESLL